MPDLITGETQTAWMTRCVPQLIGEGKTHEQAVAQCMAMHEEFQKITDPEARGATDDMPYGAIVDPKLVNEGIRNPTININIGKFKLETKEIKDVEIMSEGMFKGKNYTEKELLQFKANFDAKILEPYITIDHDIELTEKTKKELKVASLGWVESLKIKVVDGVKKLVADFKQVPGVIADLIQSGALKQKSIEFFKLLPRNGKVYENVLQGVTFFGTGIPAVNGLSDLVQLFKDENKRDAQSGVVGEGSEWERIVFNSSKEVQKMDQITISKAEYDELLKLKASAETVSEKFKDSEAQLEKFKADADTMKKELASAQKTVAEYETFKADSIKAEAEAFVDGVIKARKLAPKFRDMTVAGYISARGEKAKLEMFKEELESRAELVSGELERKPNGASKTEFKTAEDADAEFVRLTSNGKTEKEAMDIIEGRVK